MARGPALEPVFAAKPANGMINSDGIGGNRFSATISMAMPRYRAAR